MIFAIRSVRARHFPAGVAVVLMLGMVTLSCGKKGGGGGTVVPPTTATATVTGVTLGSGGLPLANATVSATPSTGATATSNSFGYFSLKVPAGTPISITASHAGFADHPIPFQLATNETRAITVVMAPFGGTGTLTVSSGGKVTDNGTKTAITLPGNFTTGTSFAVVNVTGIDPTSGLAVGMPGTIAAVNSIGTLLNAEPVAVAEVRIGDGVDTDFPLIQPATLEMHLPASVLAADPFLYGIGDAVPCFRYDDATGHWKFEADGHVAISSVDGQKCVNLTVTHLSWYMAGFLNGSSGCVSGIVYDDGVPVPGATVQAFPGGYDVTKADGTYHVAVTADANIILIATRPDVGSVSLGSAQTLGSSPPGACTDKSILLTPAAPPTTYLIAGQLIRGRVGLLTLDEVFVSVSAATSPDPTPLNGCVVQLSDGISTKTLASSGTPGLYQAITGFPGSIALVAGRQYTLRVDVEPDGHFDAIATALMPGQPTIDTPQPGEVLGPKFTASWSDLVTGTVDTVTYIGSLTANAFGTTPSRFAVAGPANSFAVGTGIGQPQFFMPNDSLETGGEYTMRLWATNGPVRYPVGTNLIFTLPNVTSTTPGASNIIGWFSAISMADSVNFTDLGTGTRPSLAMRAQRRR